MISFNDWLEKVVQFRGKYQFILVQTCVRVIYYILIVILVMCLDNYELCALRTRFLFGFRTWLDAQNLIISIYDSHVPNLPNYQFSWDGSYELICCDNQPPFYGNLSLTRCLKGLSHVCLSLCAFSIHG